VNNVCERKEENEARVYFMFEKCQISKYRYAISIEVELSGRIVHSQTE
jgi:hypothetical protein